MWKRVLIASAIFASTITALFGGEVFAVEGGNIATLRSDGVGSQSVCVAWVAGYEGSLFTADISKDDFETQIVFDDSTVHGDNRCRSFKLPVGSYTVRLNAPMGFFDFSNAISRQSDYVLFYTNSVSYKYLHSFGSTSTTFEGEEGEDPDPDPDPEDALQTVFEITGECTFSKTGKVSGETCVDANGVSYVGKDNVNTGVSLFSEENADKDFEVYFEIVSSDSSQNGQATLFNAKLEDSSRYYPGFAFRLVNNTNPQEMEITSRLGTNDSSEKKTDVFYTDDIINKGFRIVRTNGIIKYSIGDGDFVEFDDFSEFSNYFDQVAVFGSSLNSSNRVQRKFNGTIRNMRIKMSIAENNDGDDGEETSSTPSGNIEGSTSSVSPATRRTMNDQSENNNIEESITDLAAVRSAEQIERLNEPIDATTITIKPEDEE